MAMQTATAARKITAAVSGVLAVSAPYPKTVEHQSSVVVAFA